MAVTISNLELHTPYSSVSFRMTWLADRRPQRLEPLIKRGIRSGLCGADVSSLAELVDSADDALFQRILHNPNQVLHSVAYSLLPDLSATGHILDIVVMTEFYRQRLEAYRLIFFNTSDIRGLVLTQCITRSFIFNFFLYFIIPPCI